MNNGSEFDSQPWTMTGWGIWFGNGKSVKFYLFYNNTNIHDNIIIKKVEMIKNIKMIKINKYKH